MNVLPALQGTARLVGRLGPARICALSALYGILALAPVLMVLAFSGIVSAVGAPESTRTAAIASSVAWLGGLLVVQRLAELLTEPVGTWAASRVDLRMRTQLGFDLHSPTTIAHAETETVRGSLAIVRSDLTGQTPGSAVVAWFSVAARFLTAAWCLGLIAQQSLPAALIALVLLLARHRLQQHSFRMIYRSWDRIAPAAGRFEFWRNFHFDPIAAKEIRVFGLAPWSLARFRTAAIDKFSPIWEGRRAASAWSWASFAAAAAGAFTIFVVLALQSDLSAVAASQVIAAGLTVVRLSEPTGASLTIEHGRRITTSIEVVRAASAAAAASDPTPRTVATTTSPHIRMEAVRFRYPHDDRPVLTGIDLDIRPGSTLAVVGANGAGKSTLVKVLARLYEPTGGAIRIGSAALADLDPEQWRRHLAVMLQGFVRYELTLRQNIEMGAPERRRDDAFFGRVRHELGIDDLVEELPRGWATPLGTVRADGVDLSGGQWQRVALARAAFAVHAGRDVVILDEPTAHLDAKTEERALAQLAGLSASATRIIVSHRLATIRDADQIVVMSEGAVLERGTHAELIAREGAYARMFTAQAERYRQPAGSAERSS